MATDINQKVKVTFQEVNADGFMSALGGMGSIIGSITSMINPMNLAIAGIGAGTALAGIISVGSAYEDLRIKMAQTMKFMGRGGDTFNDALESADRTINQINVAAAALPGEAEDYAMAMQLAGANVDRATGDYQTSFDLIKNMTAIGIGMGHSAAETAQILSRSLQTQRGMLEMNSSYSVELLNAMKELPGHANMTLQSFNRMDLPGRVALMQQVTGQFEDMLQASAHTWSAVVGSFTSMSRQIFRLSSAPMFSAITDALGKVNTMFLDSEGHLTDLGRLVTTIGQTISEKLGGALSFVVDRLGEAAANATSFVRSLADSKMVRVIDNLVSGLSAVSGGQAAGAGGAGVAAAGLSTAGVTLFGPLAAIIIPLTAGFANFLTHTEAVTATFDSMMAIGEQLLGVLVPVIEYFGAMGALIGSAMAGIIPGFFDAIETITAPLIAFAIGMIGITTTIFEKLRPAFEHLGKSLGNLLRAIGTVLAPIVRILGHAMLSVYSSVADVLEPVVETLILVVSGVIDALTALVKWIGQVLGDAAQVLTDPDASVVERPEARRFREMLDGLADSMSGTSTSADEATESAARAREPGAPGGRGGGRVTQDFRGSRFDIQQKFDEGFDPDRIATAFASDLQRAGTRRLQSGFEPAFGVR